MKNYKITFTLIITQLGLLIGTYSNNSVFFVGLGACIGSLIDYVLYVKSCNPNKSNINSGSKLLYAGLSYQERFKRTLMVLPLSVGVIIFIIGMGGNTILNTIGILTIILLYLYQLLYNYKKIKNPKIECM